MTTIPQTDIDYLAQLPSNQICLIVSGMAALLQDTEDKVSAMQSQRWFQRMVKTVSGNNRLTAEEIKKNHDKLSAYMVEAISVLYNMNKIDHAVILSLGAQLNDVYADQIRLKERLGALVGKLNDKINSVDNFHLLNTEIEQGVYSTYAPLVGITLVLSQFDNRMLSNTRKLDIIKRSLIKANVIDSRERPITEYLFDLLEISEEDAGKVYLEWGAIRGNYVADILSGVIESYYFLPEMARKLKKKSVVLENVVQAEGLDESITLSLEAIYDDFLSSKINSMRVALPSTDIQTPETPDITHSVEEEKVLSYSPSINTPSYEELASNFGQYCVAAENGDAEAQFLLGKCYDLGLGTEVNWQKAVAWYQKSAEQGNPKAQSNLGNCYRFGFGVDEDIKEAVKWFAKSAAQGGASAQYNLGMLYLAGLGVEENEGKGADLLRAAAEQGHTEAQISLGKCYANGRGVLKSMGTANEWFLKAANQNDPEAQCLLGLCYSTGDGVDLDEAEAVKWFQKAAQQGWSYAKAMLGIAYELGSGVGKDLDAAFRLYKEAAEAGDSTGQTQLGHCYELGLGTEVDFSEAVKWYKSAVEEGAVEDGIIMAHVYLSNCYMFGKGVGIDYKEANELLCAVVEVSDEPYVHHLYAMSLYALYAGSSFKLQDYEDGIWIPIIKDYPMFPRKNSDRGQELMRLTSFEKTELGKEMTTHFQLAADCGYLPSKLCLITLKYHPYI